MIIDKLLASTQETVIETGKRIDLILSNYRTISAQIVSDPEIRDLLGDSSSINFEQSETLAERLNSRLNGYSISDNLMRIEMLDLNHAKQYAWANKVLDGQGKTLWLNATQGSYLKGKNLHEPVFAVARAVNERGTVNPLSILVVEINTHDLIKELMSVRHSGSLFVLNREGMIMLDTNSNQVGETLEPTLYEQLQTGLKGRSGSSRGVYIDGKEQLIVYHKLSLSGWTLIGLEPVSAVTKETHVIWLFTIGMVSFALLLTGFLGIFVIRNVGSPLHKLSAIMNQSRDGDLSVRVQVTSDDEIGKVGQSHNLMMDQIQALMKEAEEAVYLRMTLEAEAEQRLFADKLRQLTAELSSTLKLDEVFYRILPLLKEIASIDNGYLWILDEQEALHLKVWKSESILTDLNQKMTVPLSQFKESFVQRLSESKPIHSSYEGIRDQLAPLISFTPFPDGEWTLFPFVYHNQPVGMLLLESSKLTDNERQVISLFVVQATIAIMNASMYENMERMAMFDGLTGIYNRRTIISEGERLYRECGCRSFSVVLLDIDYFKSVNDQFGHDAGDEVLRHFAAYTKSMIGHEGIVGRYGGEEFIALLPNKNMKEAFQLAEQLRVQVEELMIPFNQIPIKVTVSSGIAEAGEQALNFQEMLTMADKKLYQAKKEGRNRIC